MASVMCCKITYPDVYISQAKQLVINAKKVLNLLLVKQNVFI